MHLSYELGCVKGNKIWMGNENSKHVNIPDWQACSILCWSNYNCTGWRYNVKGKLCTLHRIWIENYSDDPNDLIGDRDCHATRM